MSDKEKPKSCGECNFFNSAVYGRCIIKGTWFGAEDSEWIHKERPNWCPMNKEGAKDENTDGCSLL